MRSILPLIALMLNYAYGGTSLYYEECNPMACFYHYNYFFNREKESDYCKKFGNLKSCINPCIDAMPVNNSTEVKMKLDDMEDYLCYGELSGVRNDKCPAKRKFQFLSCLYEAWSLESVEQPGDPKILDCRRLFESEYCVFKSMKVCDDEAISYIEGMLMTFTTPLKKFACEGYSTGEVMDYRVKSHLPHLNAFNSLSKCFDIHHEKIVACVPNKWTFNYVISRHTKQSICEAYQEFLVCVKNILSSDCDITVSKFFVEVGKNVEETYLPHCFEESVTAGSISSTSSFAQEDKTHSIVDDVSNSEFPNDLELPIVKDSIRHSEISDLDKGNSSGQPQYAVSDVIIIHFMDGAAPTCGNLFIFLHFIVFGIWHLLHLQL